MQLSQVLNVVSVVLISSLVNLAHADLKAPDFTLKSHADGLSWTITATPPGGHHFNTEAPMSLKAVGPSKALMKPASVSEKEVQFKAPKTAAQATYLISIYLCDDAKTFCEKHEVQYTPGGGVSQARATADGSSAEPSGTQPSPQAQAQKEEDGFIANDPASAFAQAKREGKPLVIDFFGIWCPPCNELNEKVFNQKSFAKSSSRFVRLKLDVDSPISWDLKSKFHVTGYPTVVFATADGDEISRIIGFRPLPDFVSQMDDAWASREAPLTRLQALAATGDRAAADRAGVILLNLGKSAEAAHWLAASRAKREYWHMAEIDVLAEEKASPDKQIARIKQAIAEFPKTPNTVEWYEKISDLEEESKHDAERLKALRSAADLSLELSKHPKLLKGYDATVADMLESEADYRERLEGKGKAREHWLAASRAYEKRGVSANERANNLEMAFCLWKAGEFTRARAIYSRLEKIYPDEFTFYYNHARMEREAENLTGALDEGMRALDRSYGDNRLRTVKLVAQIYQGLGKPEQAKTLIDDTLAKTKLPDDEKVRTHRYANELKKLRAEL
jgi:thiol-disulfide isomerase/thioredoxin/tetratricopeptide (TPR) repeat protein